jgi:hypothetical protein
VLGLWGYAEADPLVVGILIGTLLAISIIYVVTRARRRRRER